MLCRVEMQLNQKIYGRFYRYQVYHGPDSGRMFAFVFLPALMLFMALLFWFAGAASSLVAIMAALGVVLFGYQMYARPSQEFSKKVRRPEEHLFIFTPTMLQYVVTSADGDGKPIETLDLQYSQFVKAVETKKDFYLYTSPNQALLIDKTCFTHGSADALRTTLKETMGKTFKQRA